LKTAVGTTIFDYSSSADVELLRTVPLRYVAIVLSPVFFDPTVGGIAAVIAAYSGRPGTARRSHQYQIGVNKCEKLRCSVW